MILLRILMKNWQKCVSLLSSQLKIERNPSFNKYVSTSGLLLTPTNKPPIVCLGFLQVNQPAPSEKLRGEQTRLDTRHHHHRVCSLFEETRKYHVTYFRF